MSALASSVSFNYLLSLITDGKEGMEKVLLLLFFKGVII